MDDGIHVGYLAPASERDEESFSPMSLIGESLGEPQDLAEAGAVLDMRGLEMLSEKRWMRLPAPLPAESRIDVLHPESGWEWRPVAIVEWSSAEFRIRLEAPLVGESAFSLVLPTPAGDELRRQ